MSEVGTVHARMNHAYALLSRAESGRPRLRHGSVVAGILAATAAALFVVPSAASAYTLAGNGQPAAPVFADRSPNGVQTSIARWRAPLANDAAVFATLPQFRLVSLRDARVAARASTSSRPRKFKTLRPRAWLPAGRSCAHLVRRHRWEPRPSNYRANRRVGRRVRSPETRNQRQFMRVDGYFKGRTDEILQWGACKWGIHEDIVRAVADTESSWYQSTNGDGGASWGIMQVKVRDYPGTWPHARRSTAFNVDYWGAYVRACYEGNMNWIPRSSRGNLWRCIRLWYSGSWYSGRHYVSDVKLALRTKPWIELGWPGV